MNQLQIFNFESKEVRTQLVNDQPWFCLKDVCEILEIKNATDVSKRLLEEEVTRLNLGGRSGVTNFVNESGLYNVIFRSDKWQAVEFRRWVTNEVLPTIRKHGAYMTPEKIEEALLNPDTIIQLANRLKDEREQRLIAEQRVNELQPKASYYDLILQNKTLLSVSQIAKDYGLSATTMNKKLSELGIQYKQGGTWLLYQKYANKGYTQSTTHVIDENRSSLLTKWTQKGRLFIYDLLKQNDILPLIEMEG